MTQRVRAQTKERALFSLAHSIPSILSCGYTVIGRGIDIVVASHHVGRNVRRAAQDAPAGKRFFRGISPIGRASSPRTRDRARHGGKIARPIVASCTTRNAEPCGRRTTHTVPYSVTFTHIRLFVVAIHGSTEWITSRRRQIADTQARARVRRHTYLLISPYSSPSTMPAVATSS